MSSSPVYWRIYLARDELLHVVEMQDFDEYDYTPSRFAKGDDDVALKFDSEAAAHRFLNENYKLEFINPDDRTPENLEMLKRGMHGWQQATPITVDCDSWQDNARPVAMCCWPWLTSIGDQLWVCWRATAKVATTSCVILC